MLRYNAKLKVNSRLLRSNMTNAEVKLWSQIRNKRIMKLQFYRQKPIGEFIVDFYCPAENLVIEVDGGQHYKVEGFLKDRERDAYLMSLNLKVLRFSNYEILTNIDGVISKIIAIIETKSS